MAQKPERKKQRVVIWTLRWGNPYTRPPEGQPAVLGLQITSSPSEQPAALYSLKRLGDGYAMYCEVQDPSATPRKLPEAANRRYTGAISPGGLKRKPRCSRPSCSRGKWPLSPAISEVSQFE